MRKNSIHHRQALKNTAVHYSPPLVVVVMMMMMMMVICQHQRKAQLFLFKGKLSKSHYEENGKIFSLCKNIALICP